MDVMNETFRKNLLRYMKEKGVNAWNLAKVTNSSSSTVDCWVKGKFVPRSNKLQMLADYFCCDIADLIYEPEKAATEKEEAARILELLHSRPECRILFDKAENATKEEIEQAIRIIEALRI